MQYIQNDGYVTYEYDVIIDEEKLRGIIKKLDESCYRVVNKKAQVSAPCKEEALRKLQREVNLAGVKVNGLIEISDGYKYFSGYSQELLFFDCDYLCKQSSNLVYILQRILANYSSQLDFKKQNNRLIDLLIGYANTDELKSFDVRGEECYKKIKDYFDSNKEDLDEQYRLQEESRILLQEIRLNMDFNFELLRKLYEEAKECFTFTLVNKTIHNKINDSSKIYKLSENKVL